MRKAIWVVIVVLAVTAIGLLLGVRKGPKPPAPLYPSAAASSEEAVQPAPAETPPAAAPTVPRSRAPAPPLPPLSIPDSLRVVFGEGGEGFLTRQGAVQQLGSGLSDQEIAALYHLLYRKVGEDSLQAAELNALKNEVANALKTQRRSPAVLIRHLTALFDDRTQDPVWRDYCVQHLGTMYRATEGPDRTSLRELLWSAAEEKQRGLAGTALIALLNNLEAADIDRQAVADKALAIAGGRQDYSDGARVTALQICAKLGDGRALPLARSLADGAQAVPLRVSAIAAIGTLGDATDRPLLEKYSQSTDIRLRTAGASALAKLRKDTIGAEVEPR